MNLAKLPISKKDISIFADSMKTQILDGDIDIKELLYQKAVIEKTLSAIFDDQQIKDFAIDTVESYGKEGAGYGEAKFEVGTRRSYDYSKCGDSKIESLDQSVKDLTKQKKDREKFLQFIPQSGIADPETGEIVYPAAVSVTTFIKTTLK